MILADTLAEAFRNADDGTSADAKEVRGMLDKASKFVFEPDTARLARDAIARPEKVAAQIPLPDKLAWLEFHLSEQKIGFMFYSAGEALRRARCLIVQLPHGSDELSVVTEMLDMDEGGLITQPEYNGLLMGALALLATPQLIERREVLQTKLNKARRNKGKPLLFDHTDLRLIDLDLARPQRSYAEQQETRRDMARPAHHKRHHFCRAHLRFANGQMQLVRPHWRGDASLGTVTPAYRVKA